MVKKTLRFAEKNIDVTGLHHARDENPERPVFVNKP